MTQSAPSYPDWKAPAEDGETLLWPDPAQLLCDTRQNQSQLSSADSVFVQNIPLSQVRLRQRQWIGHRDDSQPLIANGHQTELYHPGVWVKDVLMNAIARKLNGQGLHLAVDTDAPKHLNLQWPGFSMPVTDDPRLITAPWTGLLDSPTPVHVKQLASAVARALGSGGADEPMAGVFLDSMRRLSPETPSLSWALTNSIHLVDWELGLGHNALVTSPLWHSEPYLVFAHHLIAHAGAYAGDYNAALDDYRRRNGLRGSTRPMPDLTASPDACEIPFWLDALDVPARTRPSVRRCDEGWELVVSPEIRYVFRTQTDGWAAAASLNRWLRTHQLRLSPAPSLLRCSSACFWWTSLSTALVGGVMTRSPTRSSIVTSISCPLVFP